MRNHGFLMLSPSRWALSPAYDLNPVPEIDRARTLKTPITETGGEPSLAAALAAASRFVLKPVRTVIRFEDIRLTFLHLDEFLADANSTPKQYCDPNS
ncbi:MAG: hypothetical protein ABI273_13825 [Lacunisphaera sp.]